jgi:hypothetical protein
MLERGAMGFGPFVASCQRQTHADIRPSGQENEVRAGLRRTLSRQRRNNAGALSQRQAGRYILVKKVSIRFTFL